MKKYRIGLLLAITCLFVSVFSVQSTAADAYSTVSGVISLPDDDVAPSGGVKVLLTIETDNNTPNDKKDDKSVTTEITIAKGRNSIAYSIQVPKSQNPKAKYSVYYTVGNGYAPFGWYSKDGTTAIKNDRTLIDVNAGNVRGIDIELLPGRTISGKIILGNKSTKPLNDLKYTITAIQEGSNSKSNDDDIVVSKEFTVKANSSEVKYELIVPMNTAKKGYKVYYTYENGGYKETGYYSKNGTSSDPANVTLIDVANTVTNINLTTQPFTNITGDVYLPGNAKAPGEGIEVTVTAYNSNTGKSSSDDFSFSRNVKIAKGSNSARYALTVPVVSTEYIVSYKIVTKTGDYVTEGYYGKNGTVKEMKNAASVKATNKDVTDIDLEIISKKPNTKPDDKTLEKYDLNGDGYVNVFDLVDLAKVIVKNYEKEGFDKDLDQYKDRKLTEKDLETVKKVFQPFTENRYKLKWFNNLNKWFNIDLDKSWGEDWESWDKYWNEYWDEYWKYFEKYWNEWNKGKGKVDWNSWWKDFYRMNNKGKGPNKK